MFNPHFFKRKAFAGDFRRGPFGGGHGDGPGRQRQRRGDVKFVLLEMLKEQPRHGYELIKALEEQSAGFYRPSPGLVYPTLQLLEDEGYLTSQITNDKRTYTITEAGRKLLDERATDWQSMGDPRGRWGQGMDKPQLMELWRGIMALFESVKQAARYGTPEQVQAVQALVTKANQDVHAILARSQSEK